MKSFYIVLVLVTGLVFTELSAQDLQKSIAVLDLTQRNNESNDSRLFSVEHMAKVAGIPFITTDDLSVATEYGMILSSSLFKNNAFSSEEIILLENYVDGGGVLVAPRIEETDLFSLFGIQSFEDSKSRYTIHWDSTLTDVALKYIDETEERTLSLGRSTYDEIFKTIGYTPGTARTFAYFTDGSSAVINNTYGEGAAISIGVSWKEIILRNQINRDFEAHRVASNGFEPTSDVLALFVRALFIQYHPYTVWKNTSPGKSAATLMVTHDIDSSTGMDTLQVFVDYEAENNIEATYNVTVKYVDDAIAPAYYMGRQSTLDYIMDNGQHVGSHSVGHFFDFADEDIFPIGAAGNTPSSYRPFNDGNITTGGTIYGECEVSKNTLETDIDGLTIRSFRAGHLAYPNYLINVLDELGYAYNSSYSAGDVLNNFPYQNKKDRSFSGENSSVYEIPVTISDVFHDNPISQFNVFGKAVTWLAVTEKNMRNGAPTVLLIHPNRHYKLEGLDFYLDRISADMHIMEMEKFGDFWRAREDLNFTTTMADEEMVIQLTSAVDLDQNVSFLVADGQLLSSISVLDEAGNPINFLIKNQGIQDVVVYFQDFVSIVADEDYTEIDTNIHVYPNPTTGDYTLRLDWPNTAKLSIDLFDVYGKKVTQVLDKMVPAGEVEIMSSFPNAGISSGIYFLVVHRDGKIIGRSKVIHL